MINILPLTKKNTSISSILIPAIKSCFCTLLLSMKSYEIIQFEVNKNVFFTSNEIIDGK